MFLCQYPDTRIPTKADSQNLEDFFFSPQMCIKPRDQQSSHEMKYFETV